ncbi:hypothetical protein DBIPINDM_005092 [Mesorhizobium sp. AR02]|uniref:hypothetical protein n=1 Tax=Mesorhizobium sp. AR02 TaxID=2865837 RepID=UPI00216009DD|nr:hypothetical protein [Mesorhizobium sp. AR02]UVK51782.1 hypothetical protein DBIPINDM_005092 [Mesorhizobium sp. AR02]
MPDEILNEASDWQGQLRFLETSSLYMAKANRFGLGRNQQLFEIASLNKTIAYDQCRGTAELSEPWKKSARFFLWISRHS